MTTGQFENVGGPCTCLECQAAGATHLPSVKVPGDEFVSTPHWLHGEQLKAWWAAREAFRKAAMAAGHPELAREPGEDDA
jgi:hypothetical protein